MATYRGQAEKWIYPKIGSAKLKDFKVADAAATHTATEDNQEKDGPLRGASFSWLVT
jgi:hypothetical protein